MPINNAQISYHFSLKNDMSSLQYESFCMPDAVFKLKTNSIDVFWHVSIIIYNYYIHI